MNRADAIYTWWFGDAHDDLVLGADSPHVSRWFGGGPERDAEIRRLFAADLEKAAAWELSDWAENTRGRQALVLLYDQIGRALHRDTPRAFEHDDRAQSLARRSLADGTTHRMPFVQQLFLVSPLGRSEMIEDQEMYFAWSEHAADQAQARRLASVEFWARLADRARVYYEIIHRFGRFPQRNALLGREPTDEEIAFLSSDEAASA